MSSQPKRFTRSSFLPFLAGILFVLGFLYYSSYSNYLEIGVEENQLMNHQRILLEEDHYGVMSNMPVPKPGDRDRAEKIMREVKKQNDKYKDVNVALAEGFINIEPKKAIGTQQHFGGKPKKETNPGQLDPKNPDGLLYVKTGEDSYKFVGVMYTANLENLDEIDKNYFPLSQLAWHNSHDNCLQTIGVKNSDGYFVYKGIRTKEDCDKVGGTFIEKTTWMMHIYLYRFPEASF